MYIVRLIHSVDTSNAGLDNVDAYIIHDGIDVNHKQRQTAPNLHELSFIPGSIGIFDINVFCGGVQIAGKNN